MNTEAIQPPPPTDNTMDFNEYIIYVDESGDHNLKPSDPEYPIFVLVFCLFEKRAYIKETVPVFQQFKFDTFGHDNIILRERDIKHQTKPFTFLQNQSKRHVFMKQMNHLIAGCAVSVIASVIRKHELVERYVDPHNPYDLALKFCMERAFIFLNRRNALDTAHIVVESRGRSEDRKLKATFAEINREFNNLFAIVFADKKTNTTGLQVADLMAAPIGRHVLHPTQSNRAWDVIAQKLEKDPRSGTVDGWGLKVFPG